MKELLKALMKARDEFPPMQEDTKGQDGNREYTYYTWDQIVSEIFPILHKNGLILVQTIESLNGDGKHGMVARLMHVETCQELKSTEEFPAYDELKIKEIGGLHTYFARYTARLLLALRVGTDDNDAIVDKRFGRGARKPPGKKKHPGSGQLKPPDFMTLQKQEGGQIFTDFCNAIDDTIDPMDMERIADEIKAADQKINTAQKDHLRFRYTSKRDSLLEESGAQS